MKEKKTKKPVRRTPKSNTITAYVNNVESADPTVDEVTVRFSGAAFYKLLQAMLVAKAANNLYMVDGNEDLAERAAVECAGLLQQAADLMMTKELP